MCIRDSDKGTDVGVVIGGGNYWRGRSNDNIDRTKAYQIGMLATIMNCIYVSEIFRSLLPYFIQNYNLSYRAAAALIFANVLISSLLQPVFGYYSDRISRPLSLIHI